MNHVVPWAITMIRDRLFLLALPCLLLAAGCGQRGPALQPVEGFVTLDGSPCSDALIGFSPIGEGLPAVGRTGADGSYRLTVAQGGRPHAGTTVGEYAVTIEKKELIPEPQPDNGLPNPPKYRDVVPEAYGDQTTSSFRVTVRKGRNAGPDFNFDVRTDRATTQP